MLVLVELGVADPVPAFDAPALPDQSQQGFWGGAQAGEEQVPGAERFAITSAAGQQLNDPGTAWPIRFDVLRCLFGPQRPGDLAAMANLVMRYSKRDLALPLELGVDLPDEGFLVGLGAQQEVGPLLRELPKNALCVWRASAWISTPSRSSSPKSFLSSACSLPWLVA
jgi:hypothetical protein